jgi:hypothetical protein
MKTTVQLPDDLVKEVKLRALHEGKKLKDAVADLLWKGLASGTAGSRTVAKPDKAMLKRRKEITRKFIAGEWGVELAGFEAGREADLRKARQRAKVWRD